MSAGAPQIRRGLRYEIVLNMTVLAIFGLLLSAMVTYKLLEEHLISREVDNARFYAESLKTRLEVLIERQPNAAELPPDLFRMLSEQLQERRLEQAVLVDTQAKTLARVGQNDEGPSVSQRQELLSAMVSRELQVNVEMRFLRGAPLVHVTFPILSAGKLWGGGAIAVTVHGLTKLSPRVYPYFLVYLILVSAVLAAFGSVLMSKLIVQPVHALVQGTRKIAQGQLQAQVEIKAENELGELAQSFNEMAARLGDMIREREQNLRILETINEELRRAQSEILRNEKLAAIGRIAAGVAHEIGNPVGAILGYAEILKGGGLDETSQKDFVERIGRESMRIDRIIRELLEISRSSARERVEVQVAEAVQNTWDLLCSQEAFRDIRWTLHADAEAPRVSVDPHALQQTLINLFSNAAAAMQRQGALTVTVKTGIFNEYKHLHLQAGTSLEQFSESLPVVVINIEDSGPGVDPQVVAQIFEPFFTTRDPGQGTGLGLYLVARALESMRGAIAVENTGHGARFIVILPREV